MLLTDTNQPCPCGSEASFSGCCAPYVTGSESAPTAEKLMRSRYTAFALGGIDYLVDTLAPEKRSPNEAQLLNDSIRDTQWLRLEIINTQQGGALDNQGVVEFNAYFRSPEGDGCLHERSNFRREGAGWVYVDGDVEVN